MNFSPQVGQKFFLQSQTLFFLISLKEVLVLEPIRVSDSAEPHSQQTRPGRIVVRTVVNMKKTIPEAAREEILTDAIMEFCF